MVAPRLSLETETDEARDTQPLRRADFIAAARRAAQAAQAAKLGEPVPADDAGGLQDTLTVSRQPGALARIGAALRGRGKPVAIIVGVLLLAGIATELTLSNMDTIRRGIANAPSPMALLEKFRAPDPIRTASVPPRKDGAQVSLSGQAAPPAAPVPVAAATPPKDEAKPLAPLPAPVAERAIDPAPIAPQPVQPSAFGKDAASALVNRFLPTPKSEPAKPEAPRADIARAAPPSAPEPRSIAPSVDVAAAPVATPPAMDPVTTQGIGQRAAEAIPAPVPMPPTVMPAEIKPVAALTPIKTPLPALDDKIGSMALRKAATQGDARAAFEIGVRYAEGRGVTQNGVTALEWYRRAAEAGFAPAQYRLASALEKGLAGTRDLTEARRWYQIAAEKGNVRAMHNLGVLYANDRDMTTALQWFEKAAARGQKDSQFNLGIVNALGSGVKQDVASSYKWFSLAAQQGDLEATKKRDDIEQYLDKTTLASAKMAVTTWKPETVDKDTNDETTPWTEAVIGDQSLGSAGEKVARAQTLLKTKGQFAGEVDGRLTPETKTAVKAFQRKVGLKPTGEVDDALIRALASKTG
jgi:localization factor PodJL